MTYPGRATRVVPETARLCRRQQVDSGSEYRAVSSERWAAAAAVAAAVVAVVGSAAAWRSLAQSVTGSCCYPVISPNHLISLNRVLYENIMQSITKMHFCCC